MPYRNQRRLCDWQWVYIAVLASVITAFCSFGGVLIYLMEAPNEQVLETFNLTERTVVINENETHVPQFQVNQQTRERIVSVADVLDSAVLNALKSADEANFEQTVLKLLALGLNESGMSLDRWHFYKLNETHYRLLINPEPVQYPYDAWGSFFFIFDMITTIGFGNRSVSSDLSKLYVTMLCMIGCPIIQLFCDILAEKMKISGLRIGRGFMRIPGSILRKFVSGFVLESIGILLFVILPGVGFFLLENGWTYVDAIYFAVNALSTTGCGELIAAEDAAIHGLMIYRVFYMFWLFVGMAWWTAHIDHGAERLRSLMDCIARRFGCDVPEEDESDDDYGQPSRNRSSEYPLLNSNPFSNNRR